MCCIMLIISLQFCRGRLHGPGKGISSSAIPYKRTAPSWVNTTADEVEEQVCQYAKRGMRPSAIGMTLRNAHSVPQVRTITGNKILRLLKKNGLAPDIPEDLFFLIKKAVNMRKHLESNNNDKDTKFRLILIESRVHRLARYYKRTRQLEPNWKYRADTAATLVS